MNIVVIGAGAMGSVYAGLLAAAGHRVTAVTRNAAHVQAIKKRGLRVSGASGDQLVALHASTELPTTSFDLIVVAVKAPDVAALAGHLPALLAPHSTVLTLQNGLGSAAELAAAVPPAQLAVGIAGGFGARLRAPGHVHHSGMQMLRFGAFTQLSQAQLEALVSLWQDAGLPAAAADDILAMQWEKLIRNVAFSAPCALTGLTVGAALARPHIRDLCLSAAAEAWHIARATDVAIGVTDWRAHVLEFASHVADAKPSMLQDLEAGRPTEIGVINGAVPLAAERAGLVAPVNATLAALVREREANPLSQTAQDR